jgi:hypothetical protein
VTAIGFTSGDPNKVDVAGDTMTGDLIMSGASTEIIDTYQGITGDIMGMLSTTLSTGITSGGLLSINVDPTKFNVSATTGFTIDYNPNGTLGPTNPAMTTVNFAGLSAIALTGPPAQQLTFVLLSALGVVIQQAFAPTRPQYRTHLVIGFVVQSLGTIVQTKSLASMMGQPEIQLYDFARGVGGFSVTNIDNVFLPNGANLMVNTTGGGLFFPGSNIPNYQDPHVVNLTAQSPATFNRISATTILPAFFTTIDVANYDPGGLGVITPVGGGVNTSTIFRVFIQSAPVPGNEIFVQYGQSTYASLAAARDAIGTTSFIVHPAFVRQCLAGWIVATRAATDLSDPTQAFFVRASKFAIP